MVTEDLLSCWKEKAALAFLLRAQDNRTLMPHFSHTAVDVVSIFNSALQLRRRLQLCGVPGMTSDDRIQVNVNYESIH